MELKCTVRKSDTGFALHFEGDEAVIHAMWAHMCVELPTGYCPAGELDVWVPREGYWTDRFDTVPR